MGVESLAGGVGAAVGEAVGGGLSSAASGIGAGSGALGALSGGIDGGVGPGLSAGLEVPLGGLDLLGGRAGSLVDFQLAFNFGSEHSASGEIYPGKAIDQPATVFNEGLFGVVAKPSESITPESQPSPTFFEMFGPELESVAQPANERPALLSEGIFNENIFETLVKVDKPVEQTVKAILEIPPFHFEKPSGIVIIPGNESNTDSPGQPQLVVKEVELATFPEVSALGENLVDAESSLEKKEKNKEKTARETRLKVSLWPQEKTVWQILTGDLIQPKVIQVESARVVDKEVEEPVVQTQAGVEKELSVDEETKPVAQTVADGKIGGGGITETPQDEDQPEEPVEMKEPIWEMSRKKPDEEEVAKSVLERRVGVAREITGRQGVLSKITSQLVRLDIPTPREFLRIVLGQLTFPQVARKAERELKRLDGENSAPIKVWKTLEALLINRPPLQSRVGGMEHIGSLPQSEIATIDPEIARLAYQKKKEHIGLTWRGIWKGFGKKPSKYPWELDKTKITRPIDRQAPECYTLFAKRAVARAKRKEAKSQ